MTEWRKSCVIAAIACLAVASGWTPSVAEINPSASDLYKQAIKTMDELKQPAYMVYRLESKSEGLRGDFFPTCHGGLFFCVSPGNNTNRWMLWHRTADFRTTILDLDNNKRYYSDYDFFDPTWYGPYRALREGMLNIPEPGAPSPLPSASTTPDSSLKVIATVTVFGPNLYDVSDRGDATCPNGDPGRAIHLTSRTNDARHQLSDVVVDLTWMRFCSVTLAREHGLGALGGDSEHWEGHYGPVGDYWILTDGLVEFHSRILGITKSGGVWRFRLFGVQFPEQLSPDIFLPASAAAPTPTPIS